MRRPAQATRRTRLAAVWGQTHTDPGRDQGTDPRNDPRGFFNQRTKPPANTPPASTPPGFQ